LTFHDSLNLIDSLLVSGKSDSQTKVACLQEIQVMFAALKESDFDEKSCVKEIQDLKMANLKALGEAREEKLKNAGSVVTTGNKLTSQQLNIYLNRFPQPN